ncbi:MAG: hypothetical protein ACPG42_04770 [Alphaproteobacteria bacterium]
MRGLLSALSLAIVGAILVGCAATTPYHGTTILYSRIMTDAEGYKTPFRAYAITNGRMYVGENVDRDQNYAAAKLDFSMPTFLLTFQSLPGKSISHTTELSKALPLLARELCRERPVNAIERELDWDTGERKVYVECQGLFGESYDLGGDGSSTVIRSAQVDETYELRYRVVFDRNGDPVDARVTVRPDGTRSVVN